MCDFTYDEDGLPVPLSDSRGPPRPRRFVVENDLRNIFDMKGQGYDVTLSLAEAVLTWSSVSPGGKFFYNVYETALHKLPA